MKITSNNQTKIVLGPKQRERLLAALAKHDENKQLAKEIAEQINQNKNNNPES